jgi:hypothetical protein
MFRGEFKFKSANGSSLTYNIGDVVINQGRAYICKTTTISSPLQEPNSWSLTGITETFKSSVPPIKPSENQLWMADTGILYIWYKDPTGFQWIQI